jgi:PAS domain S-box-containing protein
MNENSDRITNGKLLFFEVIMVGVLVWIVDSILDYYFFYEGFAFWDLFLLDIPIHELYIRSFIIILLFGLGLIILAQTKKQERIFQTRLIIKEELFQSQKKLETIFQAIPDLYFLISRDGIYLEFKGPKEELYVPPETILGKNMKDFMPIDLVRQTNAAVTELFKTKQPQSIEYSLQMPDGEKFFHTQLLYYSKDRYVSFVRDITEYKMKEKQIIKSERSLKERNKELNSLYQISQLQDDPNLSIEDLFKISVEIITQAFEFPEVIGTKITYKDLSYSSANFKDTDRNLSESIEIGLDILRITISYPEDTQILQEETQFLKNTLYRFKIVIENKNSEEIRRDFRKKLEEEVKAKTLQLSIASDQLVSIWKNIVDPIFVISDKYEILFSNLSAQKLLGGSLTGDLCYAAIKGCTSPCESCPLFTGRFADLVVEHVIKNSKTGETQIFEIAISEIENFQGHHAMLEILRNVTARKKAEERLIDSETILQDRVTELDCLYGISTLLAKPNITIHELLKESLDLILNVWSNQEKPQARITYGGYHFTTENFKETKWKLSTLEFIYDTSLKFEVFFQGENSQYIEKINILEEIGDRIRFGILSKEAETAKNQFVSIVTDSNDAIVGLNLEGTITSWNKSAEKIFGYTAEEVLSGSNEPLVPPDRKDEIAYMISETKKGKHIDHFETKRRRKDGKILDISITASPIKNINGEIMGFSAISRDFTEFNEQQNLYQEQILKSSRFKSEFMASMSHELRTPLNSIIGFSDILLEKFYGDLNERQYHYVGNVRSSADHLLDLINDILDISKIESGKMLLYIQDIPLIQIIDKIEFSFKPELEKKNLKFTKMGLNSEQIIKADPVRLQEILSNLVSNAVKYTIEGEIMLEIVEFDDSWKFHVKDTGIGIKEEDYDLIFQEFQRIQSEYVANTEGTGLGLLLTKKLVELHGGNISFTSEFGNGSIFTFTLPK